MPTKEELLKAREEAKMFNEKKLSNAIEEAKSSGNFCDSDSKPMDIAEEQFDYLRFCLKETKLTSLLLRVKKISDKAVKFLQTICQEHPELNEIELGGYDISPEQMVLIVAAIPVGIKKIDLNFAELNETNLLTLVPYIKKFSELNYLSFTSCCATFGSQLHLITNDIVDIVNACQRLERISIDNLEENNKYLDQLGTFEFQMGVFLELQKSFLGFRNSKQKNLTMFIDHLRVQVPLIMKLLDGNFKVESITSLNFYLKVLSEGSFPYTQIPKLINCFLPLFDKLLDKFKQHLYFELCLVLAGCAQRGKVNDDEEMLYRKKIMAATFLIEYEIRNLLLQKEDPEFKKESKENDLVNLLSDLCHHDPVENQSLEDFYKQHTEEFFDILAEVAKNMDTYKLPSDESHYEIIDEEDYCSVLFQLLSKTGREQLMQRKNDKIIENFQRNEKNNNSIIVELQQENNALKKRVRELENRLPSPKKAKFFPSVSPDDEPPAQPHSDLSK